jgi:hypothetical protein
MGRGFIETVKGQNKKKERWSIKGQGRRAKTKRQQKQNSAQKKRAGD